MCGKVRKRLHLRRVGPACDRWDMRHEPTSGYEDPSLNYRVTWMVDGGEVHERIFTSRDQGWDFCESKRKSADAYKVTWEHIPAE